MIRTKDPALFRQSLLELLEAHPPREEQFLAQFERLRDEGHAVYSQTLSILTHLSFSEAEARRHWGRILSHRAWLKTELQRDPGLRVAILDYFVNVTQVLKNPKVIELKVYEATERSAVSDGLTGLFNHAYLLQALRREAQRSRRHGTPVSLLLFDLDDFKRLNDTRGHPEGDRVLVRTAALVRETLREMDLAARYGGEEFAVILPDTSRTGAYVVADRIRRLIEERFKRGRKTLKVTISGGVATLPDDAASAEELIERADQGLYRSKADGKNRITLAAGERRRHLRVPLGHKVTLDAAARRIAARVRNVSESGLLLSLGQPVPVGSDVRFVVHPQRGKALGMHGEVVRVQASDPEHHRYEVGLQLHGDRAQALALMGRSATA